MPFMPDFGAYWNTAETVPIIFRLNETTINFMRTGCSCMKNKGLEKKKIHNFNNFEEFSKLKIAYLKIEEQFRMEINDGIL